MRLVLDTNVLLDVALQRSGLVAASAQVISLCGATHQAGISWHSLSNAFYIIGRHHRSTLPAWDYCRKLIGWATVISTTHKEAQRAMMLGFTDLEDAMQAAAAEAFGAAQIITRNVADFVNNPVPAFTPEDFLQRFHPGMVV